MDTIASMQIFVATAESETLSVAARRLNISAASVTKTIQALERRLQVRLLNRTTRQFHLTEAGELFLRRCRAVLEEVSVTEAAMTQVTGAVGGTLRIAAEAGFAAAELFPVLADFIDEYPDIEPELVVCTSPPDLVRERFDLGIRVMAEQPDSSLIARRIASVRQVICAAPGHLDRHGRPMHPDDLAARRFLLMADAAAAGPCVLRRGTEERQVQPVPALRSNDIEILRQAALDGRGLLVLPSYCVCPLLAQGRLEQVLPEWTAGELGLYVVYPSRSYLPRKTRLFIDALTRKFAGALHDDIWLARIAVRAPATPPAVLAFGSRRLRAAAVAV